MSEESRNEMEAVLGAMPPGTNILLAAEARFMAEVIGKLPLEYMGTTSADMRHGGS